MIKVRLLTGVTAASAAVAALPSLAGCSQEAAQDQDVGSDSQNNTEAVAGSGELAFHGWSIAYRSTSGGDEFIRVTEKLKTSVGFNEMINLIMYSDPVSAQTLRADPSKLEIRPKIVYTKADDSKSEVLLPKLAWQNGAGNVLSGTSEEFVIPKGVKRLSLEYVAKFDKSGVPQTLDLLQRNGIQNEFVVFGAFLPNKLALFDTMGAERRTRLLEGGGVIKGSHLTISVTDWRLDTVVDKTSLDLRVGKQYSGSRFGPTIVDALGALEYEVEAVVSFDDGANYVPAGLTKVMRPDVFARSEAWRFAFQSEIAVPENARGRVKIAFHVKAFLQVPQGNIMEPRYRPGDRILLKDTWDNNDGKDYPLPIADH
jgi:hypothetical protein